MIGIEETLGDKRSVTFVSWNRSCESYGGKRWCESVRGSFTKPNGIASALTAVDGSIFTLFCRLICFYEVTYRVLVLRTVESSELPVANYKGPGCCFFNRLDSARGWTTARSPTVIIPTLSENCNCLNRKGGVWISQTCFWISFHFIFRFRDINTASFFAELKRLCACKLGLLLFIRLTFALELNFVFTHIVFWKRKGFIPSSVVVYCVPVSCTLALWLVVVVCACTCLFWSCKHTKRLSQAICCCHPCFELLPPSSTIFGLASE